MYYCLNFRALGLRVDAAETLEIAARTGFEGVDLMVRDLIEEGREPRVLKARMDELGLQGGCWPLPLDWRGDADRFACELERLPKFAELAKVLGLQRTSTWILPESRPGETKSRSLALQADRLGQIAESLEPYGIVLGLEVIGVASFRTGLGEIMATRMRDLEDSLGDLWRSRPNFGVLADAFHLHAAGDPFDACLAWGADKITNVHIADLPSGFAGDRSQIQDGSRGLPNETGQIDVAGFLRMLADAGYSGPVIAEPLAGCRSLQGLSPEESAQRARAAIVGAWPRIPRSEVA